MAGTGRLEGRTAVVTGAASGIGRAAVELFVAEGARVVAVDRDREGLEATVAAMDEGAEALVVDLADRAELATRAAELAERGRVDVLFNNAGVVDFRRGQAETATSWEATIDSNLRGHFELTMALLPALRRAPAAAIVNNASVDGLFGHPGAPVYSLAKAGMIGMTRALAHELGEQGVRINAIASGGIATAMVNAVPPAVRAEAERLTPLRRLGRPDEVARAALFLASDDASFITGATLTVDGGRTAVTSGVLGPAP